MLKIETLVVGAISTNCYIVSDMGDACVIDPGAEADRILEYTDANGLRVSYIFLTHGHFDHILAVNEIKDATGAKVVIAKQDAELLNDKRVSMTPVAQFGQRAISADIFAGDGDVFAACGTEFKYMHTPGHTRGSSVIICGENLFTGDTLFMDDCGRCDLAGGDYGEMLKSLKRLHDLEGDYKVYPGHDESTTLVRERKFNADMRRAVEQ